MITANQARKIVLEQNVKWLPPKLKKVLAEVQEIISESAQSGEVEVSIDLIPAVNVSKVASILRTAGFYVEANIISIYVSWRANQNGGQEE